jgi:PAS domain S-box-containing protein
MRNRLKTTTKESGEVRDMAVVLENSHGKILSDFYQSTVENPATNNSVLEFINQGVCQLDHEGYCLYINSAATQILGYKVEECLGKNFYQLVQHKKEIGSTSCKKDLLPSSVGYEYGKVMEDVFWKKDSSPVVVRYTTGPYMFGYEEGGLMLVFSEVSKTKKRAPVRRWNEEEVEKMIDQSIDVICTVDKHGKFKQLNAAAARVLQHNPEDLIGKKFIERIYLPDQQQTLKVAAQAILGQEIRQFKNRFVKADGTTVLMQWSGKWDEQSEQMYCIGRELPGEMHDDKQREINEQRFRSLVQEGSDLIGILDFEGNYTYVSPTSTKILNTTPAEFIGKNAFDFIHPDDSNKVKEDFLKLEKEKQILITPFRFRHKDGSWRWIETVITNLIDDPTINGLVANSRDVTEKVLTEQKIRQSEKRFKALVQEGVDLTAIIDENGICKYVTPNIPALVGYTEDELIGHSALKFIHQHDVERIKDDIRKLSSEKRVKTRPYRFRCKDNSWRWMQSTGTNLLHDEAVEGFVINTIDITDIVKATKTLQANNERYKLVNKATKDAIYDWDVIKDEFKWSGNFQKIFGHPKQVSVFRLNDWLSLIHKEDSERLKKAWNKFLTDKEKTRWSKSYRFKKGDGTFAYVEETAHLVRDEDGRPVRMIGALRDVTQSKELQDLLDTATSLSRVGAWEVDVVKQQVYWSAMTRSIHEVDDHFVPVLDKCINFYKEGYSRETIQKKINDAIKYGSSWDEELQIITAKGNEVWVRAIGNAEKVNGQCVRIFGSFQDIHKQKSAELNCQAALEEKNIILESIGDAFFAVDHNWIVTYWNQQAENILGMPREQIVGKNLWSVYEDAVGLKFYTEYHKAMSTGKTVHFEEYYPSTKNWVEVSAYASGLGLSIYFRDITSRKLADEEIYRSNERFIKVTEATNDAIWDWDIMNDRLNYSGGFQKLFGYYPDVSMPALKLWSRQIYIEDQEAVMASLAQAINNVYASEWQMEYRLLKSDGYIAHVMDRGVIVRDKDGKALRMVGALSDITVRKQQEYSLKSLNDSLQARAEELSTYVKAIEVQNERLKKIAWTQSHLVREPLTKIMGIAKLLVDQTLDEEQKDEMLNYILTSANQLDTVIKDVVQHSQMEKLNLQLKQSDILIID